MNNVKVSDGIQILMHSSLSFIVPSFISLSAMDKSDLLVHVQKLSMMLEQERAKASESVEKIRKRVSTYS